jgi:hypothetical protein
MSRATRTLVADQAILDALDASGALSTREISTWIRRRAWRDWSERHGYDFEWETDEEPVGARLLASAEARDRGILLSTWEIYRRLRWLERRGLVERIQIPGRRPMLWRLGGTTVIPR